MTHIGCQVHVVHHLIQRYKCLITHFLLFPLVEREREMSTEKKDVGMAAETKDMQMMETKKKKGRSCHLNDPYLKEFLDDNTIAGMNHIFKGKSKIRRLIWALIFIGSMIACITLISISFRRFISKPTSSTITVVTENENAGVDFPAVTICNHNLEYNASDFVIHNTYNLMNYLFNADENFHLSGSNESSVIKQCQGLLDAAPSKLLNATIWNIQNPSKTIDEMIHYCGFIEGLNGEVEPCKDAFKPVLTSAGICFTFNGSSHGIHSTGIRYGLKLILNIQQEKRPSFNGKSGVKLVIHNGGDIARPNLYGISVPPGRAIDIGVRRKATKDETSEAGCTDDKDLPFFPRGKYDYSQFACRENAIMEHIAKKSSCNCVIHPDRPSTGAYSSTPNCTISNACCLLREYTSFHPQSTSEKCPLPCSFSYYERTASSSSFPNGRYLDRLVNTLNMSADYIKNNFLSVNVFLDDIQLTTTITQYTYGPEALLGEIGGQLGLFIGVSIITVFEVLVLCVDELKRLCFKFKIIPEEKINNLESMITLPEVEEDQKGN